MRSRLSPEVAANRLQRALANEDRAVLRSDWLTRVGNYDMARMTGQYLNGQLVLRMRGGTRNSWRPNTAVEIVPRATGGSLVRLHPREPVAVTVFMWIWLVFGIVLTVLTGAWPTLIMVVFGVGLVVLGRSMAGAQLRVPQDWVTQSVASGGEAGQTGPTP